MMNLRIAALKFWKLKTLPLCLLLVLASFSSAWAQEKTVTGHVKNEKDGTPLGGATVQVKGTTTTTVTDEKGAFSIKAGNNQTLVVSTIGFTTVEKEVGNQSVVDFNLVASDAQMEGVVVTALGISRQQKALGYSAQQVGGEELTDARTSTMYIIVAGARRPLNTLSLNHPHKSVPGMPAYS